VTSQRTQRVRRHTARAVAVAALALVTACPSSPASHFYALSATPPSGARRTTAVAAPVHVAAVHIPPSVDRRQMVRMTGPNSVQISETERWSAPLDEMLGNVLAQDLAARLPEGAVLFPRSPAPSGARALVVTLAELGPGADGHVRLTASWSLLASGSPAPVVSEKTIDIDAGPAANAEEAAAAVSRALGELADQIAAAL